MWILNTIIISALIIMIAHYLYEHFQTNAAPAPDLADLKTKQYKAIIEKMVKEKETVVQHDNMDTELTEYMKSKIDA